MLAALLPLAAVAQTDAPGPAPASPKYSVYAGFSYTSLNQVNLSRHGLMGVKVSVTRDFGKYFGLMAAGDYNKWATGIGNPGNPVVYTFMVGPELHFDFSTHLGGLVFGEVGAEHTGGEGMTPNISFAGGVGGGMSYKLSDRWSIRATGDRVAASFSLRDNTPQLAYSTHRTWNPRASIGAVYRF